MCVRAASKNTHISQVINFQGRQQILPSCHTHLTSAGVLYIYIWHNYITLRTVSLTLKKCCFYLSRSLPSNGHATYTLRPRRNVERQHFPLTSVSPGCDIQPRSAVISGRPEEEQAVEKFKQHARKHTHTHGCSSSCSHTSAEKRNGLRCESGTARVTASDCQRAHGVTHSQ